MVAPIDSQESPRNEVRLYSGKVRSKLLCPPAAPETSSERPAKRMGRSEEESCAGRAAKRNLGYPSLEPESGRTFQHMPTLRTARRAGTLSRNGLATGPSGGQKLKAIAARSALALIAMFAVVGCPKKDDDTTEASKTEESEDGDDSEKKNSGDGDDGDTPEPQPSAKPAKLEPDQPKPASGRAAQELDGGKVPASDFTGVDVTAGRAKFTGPKDWKKSTNEGYTVFESADGKARFGANGSTNPSGDLEKAAKALGLTDCKWGTAGSISMGKDNLAADAADGTCKRGAGEVQAVYAALSGEGSIAIGSWDAGGDDKNVFESFRSATKVAGGLGVNPIAACCAALAQNAASAPPQFKGAYIAAAGACNAVKNDPRGMAALGGARAALAGASLPAACR